MWWNISMKISQVESNAKITDSKFWIDETIHCKNLLIFCFSSHILISEPVRIYLECIQKSHYLYARIYFVNMSIEYNLWARKTVSKVLRQRMRTISSTSCLLRLPRWILFFFSGWKYLWGTNRFTCRTNYRQILWNFFPVLPKFFHLGKSYKLSR